MVLNLNEREDRMKKLAVILMSVVVIGLVFGCGNSFAKPYFPGDWVLFGTVESEYVGESGKRNVYYDKGPNYSKIEKWDVDVRIWIDDPRSPLGGHVEFVSFFSENGVWTYLLASERVERGISVPKRIIKGSLMHILLKSLKRANPIIDFNG